MFPATRPGGKDSLSSGKNLDLSPIMMNQNHGEEQELRPDRARIGYAMGENSTKSASFCVQELLKDVLLQGGRSKLHRQYHVGMELVSGKPQILRFRLRHLTNKPDNFSVSLWES